MILLWSHRFCNCLSACDTVLFQRGRQFQHAQTATPNLSVWIHNHADGECQTLQLSVGIANHVQLLIANCNSSQWSKHIVDRHNSSSGPMQWWSLPHVPPVLSYYSISDVQLHLTGWYTLWYIHYSNCTVKFYISLAAETTASTSVWGHSSLDASWTHALTY